MLGRSLLAAASSLILVSPTHAQGARLEEAGTFLIRDVRVFDGENVLEHRDALFSNGEIMELSDQRLVQDGATVIEGAGRTLLPGLIDSHVHVPGFGYTEDALAQSAAFGVTTVIDMFSSGETFQTLKRIRVADDQAIADLRTAGVGATAPGGHPSQLGSAQFPTLSAPEEAASFVEARLSEGSDFIKIIYDDAARYGAVLPTLDATTVGAIVAAAHDRQALAVAHIGTEAQARDAITAGVDGLAHLFTAETVSPDFGVFAADHGIFVIPTLSVLHSACGASDGSDLIVDDRIRAFLPPAARDQAGRSIAIDTSCAALGPTMQQLSGAQVPILAGTDAAAAGTAYGASLHGELALMVGYGMSPVQALAAATSAPAAAFRLADRGAIRPGLRADLVLVDGDPTTTITDTRNIVAVWKRGFPVTRETFD